MPSSTVAQGLNKTVFGPLVGDDAGVLTVHNGEAIELELWVRTDPDNPTPVIALSHGLLSEDIIIAERNGMDIEPEYDMPNWESVWVDGPFYHNPDDDYPIPDGWTSEVQGAIYPWDPPWYGPPLDTQGEWDLYGTWLMDTNVDVPTGQVYLPFSEGWYPHRGQGTYWAFGQPHGGIVPEQDYCGLHFVTSCQYIPGDCNSNWVPMELTDVICMIGLYRGTIVPLYTCPCPPHGNDFPLQATVDSNCVVMELDDVVLQIYAYRSDYELWGCPDCPGILGILPRDENRQQPIPFLKSRVKDKRGSFPE